MLQAAGLKSSLFRNFYVEKGCHTPTFDFRKQHSKQPLSVSSTQLVTNFLQILKYLIQLGEMLNYRLSVGLIWRHHQSPFSLSYFRNTSPHQIQAHNFLHICNPLYSHGPVINPVYHQKAIRITNCQNNNSLQRKVGAIANLFTNTVTQHQNTVQAWFFLQAQTGLPAAGRGCTNTL